MFLFKNNANEANASMPDTPEDPISYDFASEEVYAAEAGEHQADQSAAFEEANKKQMEEMKKLFEEQQKK